MSHTFVIVFSVWRSQHNVPFCHFCFTKSDLHYCRRVLNALQLLVTRSLFVHGESTSAVYAAIPQPIIIITKERKQQRGWAWVSVFIIWPYIIVFDPLSWRRNLAVLGRLVMTSHSVTYNKGWTLLTNFFFFFRWIIALVLTVYFSQRGPSGPKFLVSGGYFVRKRLQYRITKKMYICV